MSVSVIVPWQPGDPHREAAWTYLRPAWEAIPAVKDGHVVEIKSAILLAPGPAAIREGLPAIGRCLDRLG